MRGHWFVVASQNTAQIFTEIFGEKNLEQLKKFDNPLGRMRNRELIRKQAGKGAKSAGRGSLHYSETKRHDPHEEAARQFAKEIVTFLEKARLQKAFKSLTVVAEPHFLGKLKAFMEPHLKELVSEWVKKDLLKTPKSKLSTILLSTGVS